MNHSISLCPSCNISYQETDMNCQGCSYPLQGTQQAKDFFTSEREVKQMELDELSSKVDSARKSLFVIAGLNTIFSVIMYLSAGNHVDKISNLIAEAIVVAIFIGLGFWAKKKAKIALITGLVIFVGLHLLNALFDPMSIIYGILYKVIIVAYLIKGIKAVSQSDQLKKELNIV